MPAGNPGATPAPGASPPTKSDQHTATVLWRRVLDLQPDDFKMFDQGITKPMGLLMLKLVPELAPLILQSTAMQGPDMQPVRDAFNHDAVVAKIQQHIGAMPGAGGGLPTGVGGPAAAPPGGVGSPMPPGGQMPPPGAMPPRPKTPLGNV